MIDMNDIRIVQAKAFCIASHAAVAQKRKYTGEPYHVHPFEVAEEVATIPGATVEMVIAALLHDVVEDTRKFVDEKGNEVKKTAEHLKRGGKLILIEGITLDLIEQVFGAEVRRIVAGLTDTAMPWDGNRKTRMAINREHAAEQEGDVQTVKLVDIKSNIRDIGRNDPDFAPTYFNEKFDAIQLLTKGYAPLKLEVELHIKDFFKARKAG